MKSAKKYNRISRPIIINAPQSKQPHPFPIVSIVLSPFFRIRSPTNKPSAKRTINSIFSDIFHLVNQLKVFKTKFFQSYPAVFIPAYILLPSLILKTIAVNPFESPNTAIFPKPYVPTKP